MKTSNEKALLCKFLKTFKGPSFHCKKFLDLKSLGQSSNLYTFLILIIQMGGLLVKFFAKVVRISSKSENEK